MADFGEIKPVNVRESWPNEARDFTPWLADHIDLLGGALGMDLEVTTCEADVGDFSLDLLAKDLGSGRPVVIENQFGTTNHDHLGKVITYAAGVDATAVIWLTESLRDEHRQALEWLNQKMDEGTRFFGVVIEVIRIDESRPAVRFRPVVYPNEWQHTTRETAEHQASPRGEKYRHFFQILIDELRETHHFTRARAAQPQCWYFFPCGVQRGVNYGASFAQGGRVRAEVYIDQGDAEANKAIFDSLFSQRAEIEHKLEEPLEWERLDDRRASRIALYREGHIEQSEEELREIRGWMIERVLRLKRVLGPRLVQDSRIPVTSGASV
jgi:hypothetical protein